MINHHPFVKSQGIAFDRLTFSHSALVGSSWERAIMADEGEEEHTKIVINEEEVRLSSLTLSLLMCLLVALLRHHPPVL